MVKVWSAAHDERTRVAHAEADGQTRPVDEPFEVGGELLRYPGDRANGSAKNTIQCRCTATYVEDEIGADIPWATRINSMRDVERQIRELDMDALAASGAKGLEWKGRLAPVGEPTGDG
ncbi:phage minor head protein, partial [Glaesserella parasuis]